MPQIKLLWSLVQGLQVLFEVVSGRAAKHSRSSAKLEYLGLMQPVWVPLPLLNPNRKYRLYLKPLVLDLSW